MKNPDEQLIEHFLAGDERAFETLVEKYLKPLYNFIFQLVRDKEAANDITQDVFVKVWKNIASFDEQKKFSTWIFAIAKNAAFDFLKKKKTISFSVFENAGKGNLLEYIEDETILHSHALLQKMDNAKDAEELLALLPVQMQTILLLHHAQGFTLIEIAEIFGQSSNTLKSKYYRAILFLRNQIPSKKAEQM